MDALYRLGRASAAEIHRALPNAPTYSTVRKMLSLLEEKGHVRHDQDGLRYIYEPTLKRDAARKSALRHLVQTFFAGSEEELVTTMARESRLSPQARSRLARLLRDAGAE